MAKANPKAIAVRALILANIKLVQNNQDDIVIKLIEDQVGYAKKSDNKRAYNQQKDKVLAEYRNTVAAEAAEPTRNKDGAARKDITERKGKQTLAAQVRELITQAITDGKSLGEACDQIEDLVVARYTAKGKLDQHKPSYYRLIARNELERLAPAVQAAMGVPVNTPQELKLATRSRGWERKTV